MEIVNMFEFFPWTWLIHFVRAFVAFNISHAILKDKYNNIVTFVSIIIPCMLYSYLTITVQLVNYQNEILIMAVYYFVIFVILVFVTEGNLFSKLFAAFFSLLTYLVATLTYNVIKSLAVSPDLSSGLADEVSLIDYLVCVLFVFSFSFLFTFIISLIKNKRQETFIHKSKFSFFFLFPASHLFTATLSFIPFRMLSKEQAEIFLSQNKFIETVISILYLICILIDLGIIFIVDRIEKIEEKNIRYEKELVKSKLDYQQMLMIKEEKQEFRKIKHDFANIITTVKGFIEIGKPEKALSVLQSTNDDLTGLAGFSLCSNETINTILYIKHQQAKSNEIQLVSKISESYPAIIDDYDLCRLLNNIIDNSLNAALNLKDNRICKINIIIDEDKIIIKSENHFTNDKENKKSTEHGNGIGIIQKIASKYDGKYVAKHENDIWYTETYLNNKTQ